MIEVRSNETRNDRGVRLNEKGKGRRKGEKDKGKEENMRGTVLKLRICRPSWLQEGSRCSGVPLLSTPRSPISTKPGRRRWRISEGVCLACLSSFSPHPPRPWCILF